MSVSHPIPSDKPLRTLLYGGESNELAPLVERHARLNLVEHAPDMVICYGGDGTLLAAERRWPGVPKVPIRNSRRGKRCIGRPPSDVIDRLAAGALHANEYIKLACWLKTGRPISVEQPYMAMNEFNVHMKHINSAVRFNITFDDEPYDAGRELIGDGFVVCTPFGSTAYFKQITRGMLYTGLGIGFKFPSEQLNHIVVPESTCIHARILRGPAVLAFDNCDEYPHLEGGDELRIQKHDKPAIILTWDAMRFQSDAF